MCGIIVVASLGESGPPPSVERMRDLIAHRGPDDASMDVIDHWIAIGHRRLSIIDLEGAKQPLRSERGDVVCIFNGEIYNFEGLRARLIALGHKFESAGDGEVIVHGYEQWGDQIFAELEGMFAAAIVDRSRQLLLLARDRFGIKPLFYSLDGHQLTAASEIKALLAGRETSVSASALALELGGMRMHVPWPLTAFDGIYRLPPGTFLAVQRAGAPTIHRFTRAMEHAPASDTDTSIEAGHHVLATAVRRQMVADVPVGAFLSGGVDSSLIVALMRESTSGNIHTFSIRTRGDDESAVAAHTGRLLETTHHEVDLEEITFEALAELPELYDEPFAETSALGVRALSRFARQYVKVVLSGDGGDEVFGGYASYRWIRMVERLGLRRFEGIAPLAHGALVGRAPSTAIRRALRAALLLEAPAAAQRDLSTLSWAASRDARRASELLSSRIEASSGIDLAALDPGRLAMLADRLERLPNAMLSKVDIASMSASLEVRVPMLDDTVVRYADRLPIGALIGVRRGKLLLRRILGATRAHQLAWVKKRGFSLPLHQWMMAPRIRKPLGVLFGDCDARVRDLTGVSVNVLWRSFLSGDSRLSAGTAAMQLLWFANVALWANRFNVKTVVHAPLPDAVIA